MQNFTAVLAQRAGNKDVNILACHFTKQNFQIVLCCNLAFQVDHTDNHRPYQYLIAILWYTKGAPSNHISYVRHFGTFLRDHVKQGSDRGDCKDTERTWLPIMITSFSQYIVTQATMNVTVGERYKSVTDDIIKIAMGYFGKQAAPMDQNVKDKILSSPKAKEIKERPRLDLKRLRQEIGSGLSDDEFLLRTLVTEEQIKAMEAAGPIKTEYPAKKKLVMALIQQLMKSNMHYIRIKEPDFSIVLS